MHTSNPCMLFQKLYAIAIYNKKKDLTLFFFKLAHLAELIGNVNNILYCKNYSITTY